LLRDRLKQQEGSTIRVQEQLDALGDLLGDPKTGRVTLKNLAPKAGSSISLLGENEALAWVQSGEDVEIKLPSHLAGHYAYVLKMSNPKS